MAGGRGGPSATAPLPTYGEGRCGMDRPDELPSGDAASVQAIAKRFEQAWQRSAGDEVSALIEQTGAAQRSGIFVGVVAAL